MAGSQNPERHGRGLVERPGRRRRILQGVRFENCKAYFQVVTDLNRLAAQIASRGRILAQSAEGVGTSDNARRAVLEALEEGIRSYEAIHFENQ